MRAQGSKIAGYEYPRRKISSRIRSENRTTSAEVRRCVSFKRLCESTRTPSDPGVITTVFSTYAPREFHRFEGANARFRGESRNPDVPLGHTWHLLHTSVGRRGGTVETREVPITHLASTCPGSEKLEVFGNPTAVRASQFSACTSARERERER